MEKQIEIVDRLYEEVVSFCASQGLLEELNKSLIVPEGDRFSSREISSVGLDILDAVHCLVDKGRTIPLLYSVYNSVKPGDIVIEAGVGTGILSFAAELKGAVVYGFEINDSIYQMSSRIRMHLVDKGLIVGSTKIVMGDARNIDLNIKADVLISENLYTGMFFEKQIDIVNALLPFLKKKGKIIPSGMETSLFLCSIDGGGVVQKNKFRVLSETGKTPKYLSIGYMIDKILFSDTTVQGVSYYGDIDINSDGLLNSILVCSDVLLPDGNTISRFDTEFMNNDIIFLLKDVFEVKKGDKIRLAVNYMYGSNPEDISIDIRML